MGSFLFLGTKPGNQDYQAMDIQVDYLWLMYVVNELRRVGDVAQSHLTVLSAEVARRTRAWRGKYAAGHAVVVAPAQITADDLARRRAEVLANARSMVGLISGPPTAPVRTRASGAT